MDFVKLLGKKARPVVDYSSSELIPSDESRAAWRLIDYVSLRLEELKGIARDDTKEVAYRPREFGLSASKPGFAEAYSGRLRSLVHVAQQFAQCDQDGTTRLLWIELCEDQIDLMDQAKVWTTECSDAHPSSQPTLPLEMDDNKTPGDLDNTVGAPGKKCPFGLHILDNPRAARRGSKTVEFGSNDLSWKLFNLLVKRYPGYCGIYDIRRDALGAEYDRDDNTIHKHMSKLRSLLAPLQLDPRNKRGQGYRLEDSELSPRTAKHRKSRSIRK